MLTRQSIVNCSDWIEEMGKLQDYEEVNRSLEVLKDFCKKCNTRELEDIILDIEEIFIESFEKYKNYDKFAKLTPEQSKSSMEYKKKARERD